MGHLLRPPQKNKEEKKGKSCLKQPKTPKWENWHEDGVFDWTKSKGWYVEAADRVWSLTQLHLLLKRIKITGQQDTICIYIKRNIFTHRHILSHKKRHHVNTVLMRIFLSQQKHTGLHNSTSACLKQLDMDCKTIFLFEDEGFGLVCRNFQGMRCDSFPPKDRYLTNDSR